MATKVSRTATRKKEKPIRVGSIVDKFRQWAVLKHESNATTTRMNHLRDEISAYVETNGEQDDKGSFFFNLPDPVEVNGLTFRTIKREKRVSVLLDEDKAEEFLHTKGLYDEATETITVLSEDKIYLLHQEGKITEDEIDSLFKRKESFAFKPIAD